MPPTDTPALSPILPSPERYTLDQILEAADSLFDPSDPIPNIEYARGICELIGRLRLKEHLSVSDTRS